MPTSFYAVPVSNYSATVRLLLQLKGVPFVERAPLDGYGSAAYKALVPTGTVPAIADDLVVLSESAVIAEYLDERYPSPPLLPPADDPAKRATVRLVQRLHDTRVEPPLRALFGHVDPTRRDPAVVEAGLDTFERRLAELGQLVQPAPFFAGELPTVADYAYPATLLLGERMGQALDRRWLLPPTLAPWWHRLRSLPAVAAMLHDYERAVDAWIASRTSKSVAEA